MRPIFVVDAYLKTHRRAYYLLSRLPDPVKCDRNVESYLRASDGPSERKRGTRMTHFGAQGGQSWAIFSKPLPVVRKFLLKLLKLCDEVYSISNNRLSWRLTFHPRLIKSSEQIPFKVSMPSQRHKQLQGPRIVSSEPAKISHDSPL